MAASAVEAGGAGLLRGGAGPGGGGRTSRTGRSPEARVIGWELEMFGMSPDEHPMRLYCEQFQAAGDLTYLQLF